MKRVFKVLLVLLIALVPVLAVSAKTKTTTTTADKSKTPINFYVFYGNGCPHCADLLEYLAELDKDENYNYMYKIVKYETYQNSENAALLQKVFTYFEGESASIGVPLYVIGDQHFTGFPNPDTVSEETMNETYDKIKSAIKKAYNDANYKDVVDGLGKGTIDVSDADKNEDDNKNKKTNDIIGYVIIGIVVIVIVAIIFGRSKSDTYYPVEEDEDEEVEEKEVEKKPVATKVAVKKPAAKSTAKKTTKTTSTKKTTAKKTTAKKTTTKKNTKKK